MNIDDGRVVSNFIAQAIRNEPLTHYNRFLMVLVLVGLSPTIYYGVLVSYIIFMLSVDGLIRLIKGSNTGPINIGNPGEFTMIELDETVKEHYICLRLPHHSFQGQLYDTNTHGLGSLFDLPGFSAFLRSKRSPFNLHGYLSVQNTPRQNLLREIVGYLADVICLQEVQSDNFEEFFSPELDNMDIRLCLRRRLLRFTMVEFNKVAQSLTDALVPNAQKKIVLNRLVKDNVALIAVLEAKFSNQEGKMEQQIESKQEITEKEVREETVKVVCEEAMSEKVESVEALDFKDEGQEETTEIEEKNDDIENDDVITSDDESKEELKESTGESATTVTYIEEEQDLSTMTKEILEEEAEDKSVDAQQSENGGKDEREQQLKESVNKQVDSCINAVEENIKEGESDSGKKEEVDIEKQNNEAGEADGVKECETIGGTQELSPENKDEVTGSPLGDKTDDETLNNKEDQYTETEKNMFKYVTLLMLHGFNNVSTHLREVPEYLLDNDSQASKFVKLNRDAMGRTNNNNRGSRGTSKKAGDPLKTFSAQVLQAMVQMGVLVPTGDMTVVRQIAFFFLNSFEESFVAQRKERELATTELGFKQPLSKEENREENATSGCNWFFHQTSCDI
ncbi:carbon catabolite repressor protein 4 homolog 1-like protein [Tanacetum coccineum]